MAKLGYTWYPKDWGNSEAVFELNLTERGLYRELIDLAMLNDNKTKVNYNVWCRKWDISEDELILLIESLMNKKLINFNGEDVFVESCEARLNLVRGGKKGGQKSKPIAKPTPKPIQKPTSNQKKDKVKEIEIKDKINNVPSFEDFKNYALEKSERVKIDIDLKKLELKYESWKVNDWKDGHNVPIKNWKSKLLNTLSYLKIEKISGKKEIPKTIEDEFAHLKLPNERTD